MLTTARVQGYQGLEWASPPQMWIVHTLSFRERPNELHSVCGAGIELICSVGTAVDMPYTWLICYPCENQTQSPGKDVILAVVLRQYNE